MRIVMEELLPESKTPLKTLNNFRLLLYVLQGRAFIRVDGHHYPLVRDECVEIPPGVRHQIYNWGENTLRYLLVGVPEEKEDQTLSLL
jgi:mannose-6-phosphate isomerase-like protein (cupin superfamily)